MDEATIGQQLMTQVVPQLVTAGGLALPLLIWWRKSKTAKTIRANTDEGLKQKILLKVSGLVLDLAGEAGQTVTRELKKALVDGRVSEDEYKAGMAKVKKDLITRAWAETGGELLGSGAVLNEAKGLEMLSAKVEAAVPIVKAAQAAAASGGGTKRPDPPQG
jgi:hypothetical protein